MQAAVMLRLAVRSQQTCFRNIHPASQKIYRSHRLPAITATADQTHPFSTGHRLRSSHGEETFEEFTARYEKEFDSVQDVFELQRNLNNAFAYDLVPAPAVITAALRAARRVNDYPTAVRIFEGIKAKVENKSQYHEYLQDLEDFREELGVDLKENLYPEQRYTAGANTHG